MAFELVSPLRTRRPETAKSKPIRTGIAANIKNGAPGRRPYLILRLNTDVMNEARLLVDDAVDVLFSKDTKQIAIRRNPHGAYIIRPENFRGAKTPAGQIKISNLEGLTTETVANAALEYAVDDDSNPSILLMKLPEQFFKADIRPFAGVFAELRAA